MWVCPHKSSILVSSFLLESVILLVLLHSHYGLADAEAPSLPDSKQGQEVDLCNQEPLLAALGPDVYTTLPHSLLQRRTTQTQTGHVSKGTEISSTLEAHAKTGNALQFVTSNDFTDLTSSLIVNGIILGFHVFLFCLMRFRLPNIYSNAWLTGRVPFSPGEGFFTWVWICWNLTPQQISSSAGLDAALLIKFQDLCINLLTVLGLPMIIIMCPLHWFCGEAAEIDPLSKIDIQHLTDGSWVYWIHGVIVWIVALTVQNMIFNAQSEFLNLRYAWLRNLPQPRATTCLVQNIPAEYRQNDELKAFVNSMFMREVVESAYVVRKLPDDLLSELESMKKIKGKLQEAENAWYCHLQDPLKRPQHKTETNETVDSIHHFTSLIEVSSEAARAAQKRVEKAANEGDESVCSSDGFVTFKRRHDAELALSMKARTSADEVAFSMPPDPVDIRYDVLQQGGLLHRRRTIFGSLLIMVLFFSYLPIVIAVSLITSLRTLRHVSPFFEHVVIKYPMFTSLWDGVAGSAVLSLFLSFVPTLMMLIIRNFFGLAAETWCQHRLQHWYFFFQILFVLMIFCIGNSLFTTYFKLVKNPTHLLSLLASTLPATAHFYLNFFPRQWGIHASQLCRYMNWLRYNYYKGSMDTEQARELAEPEDQDYFGMGARSAQPSLLFVIALVFSSVCPAISLLALVDFLLCRVVFAYLLFFAETQKADTGGQFWCTQLQHTQLGLFLYITLMVGILTEKSGAYGPGLLAASAYVYLVDSNQRLERQFRWNRLPFEELVAMQISDDKVGTKGCYVQPELLADAIPGKPQAPSNVV